MYYSRSGRNRSFYTPRRKRRNNLAPKAIFWIIMLFIVWTLLRWFVGLFSDVRSEDAFAQLQIIKGQAEFSLEENQEWTPAYSDQQFLPGDTLRTKGSARVSLEILGNNFVFLDERTTLKFEAMEETSSGKKNVLLSLESGRAWVRVSEDGFGNDQKSRFEITTPRSRVHVRGTIFDFSTSEHQDSLRLMKGSVEAEVFAEEERSIFIPVGVGQKLIVNNETLSSIAQGRDALDIVDNSFLESEWHLENLERFAPQEVADIRRRIELKASRTQQIKDPTAPVASGHPQPEILTPASGTVFSADRDSIKIEGVAPENTLQMVVNGYTLTRFQPGDRKWGYFASKKFGTLVPGENIYSVVAVSYDGLRSDPKVIKVTYEGLSKVKDETAPLSSIGTIDSQEFSAPVLTSPPILSDGTPYQTSSEVVTLKGLVDPKTNRVEINGFKLKRFSPGQTQFSYIANARYGNMEEGENIFEIKAFGPDDKTAITKVTIVYTPLNIGN